MQSPSTLISYLLNIDRDEILTIQENLRSIGIDPSKYDCFDFFNINHPDFHVYCTFAAIVTNNHFFSEYGVTIVSLSESVDINIKGHNELDFMDSIKLIDMLITDSFPSQVVAYYRDIGQISSKIALRERKIIFSDGVSSVNLAPGGAGWVISSDNLYLSDDEIGTALRRLNGSFFSARHAELFQGTFTP